MLLFLLASPSPTQPKPIIFIATALGSAVAAAAPIAILTTALAGIPIVAGAVAGIYLGVGIGSKILLNFYLKT